MPGAAQPKLNVRKTLDTTDRRGTTAPRAATSEARRCLASVPLCHASRVSSRASARWRIRVANRVLDELSAWVNWIWLGQGVFELCTPKG